MARVWLVGHDFSAESREAVELAARDLGHGGGTLALVHVHAGVEPPAPDSADFFADDGGLVPSPDDPEEHLRTELGRVAAELRQRHPALTIDARVVAAWSPGKALLEVAREIEASRVIVGATSGSALRRFVVGSVSEYLLEHAPMPVVLVRTRSGRA